MVVVAVVAREADVADMQKINNQTPRILAALLSYPQADLMAALPEMTQLLQAEGWLNNASLQAVTRFMNELAVADLLDAQEMYVSLFDRTPSLSLHLFEHVHGDSRDRGQALVDLDQIYRAQGLHNATEHTPDYLPMFLEYVALLPLAEVRAALDGVVEILGALAQRLRNRQSSYADLLEAVTLLAARKPDPARLQASLLADDGQMPDNERLDAAWGEQFALAPPQQGSSAADACPKAADMLARMHMDSSKTGAAT